MDTKKTIEEAVAVLRDGGVILYPTDTVWGIGCDACNEKAVEKVFEIKRRPGAKSLIVLAADLDMVAKYVKEIPSVAVDLVEVNDAPMTIIYPGAQYLAPNVAAEDGSVGIRIPLVSEDSPETDGGAFCRELVRRLRRPITSTSANVSGQPSPLSFDEIPEEVLSAVDYVVPRSFGRTATGRASQIIKLGLKGEVEVIRP
ncbi:MAG TPA: threonylcarbamoyl-AMP synthase [Candidatus Cryptobacteroides merdipullorum]|uniref:L-threonylcarbamoyladenylate synthase n=1 Tax=Candidatus Cryptobacteroides merdipullorum TaxID=2840771 RepID=A0A9D1GM67_9BACT|nr:threonylcarbamoyl-AMP synthase [Candidatus Cryptobacteroides merdipullorum]